MERIKISDFKARIEEATEKRLHKTVYDRYRKLGLAPKNKQRKKYLRINVEVWIKEIVEYESKNLRDRIIFNREARFLANDSNLAFNLMNNCLR